MLDDAVLKLSGEVAPSEDRVLESDAVRVIVLAVLEPPFASALDPLLSKTEFTIATTDVACSSDLGTENSKVFVSAEDAGLPWSKLLPGDSRWAEGEPTGGVVLAGVDNIVNVAVSDGPERTILEDSTWATPTVTWLDCSLAVFTASIPETAVKCQPSG